MSMVHILISSIISSFLFMLAIGIIVIIVSFIHINMIIRILRFSSLLFIWSVSIFPIAYYLLPIASRSVALRTVRGGRYAVPYSTQYRTVGRYAVPILTNIIKYQQNIDKKWKMTKTCFFAQRHV